MPTRCHDRRHAPPPTPDPTEILERAAELIDRGGLARHRFAGPNETYSVEGALERAYRDLGGSSVYRAHREALKAAGDTLTATVRPRHVPGRQPLSAWSDSADPENVVAALRRAALKVPDLEPDPAPARRARPGASSRPNPYEW